MTTFVLHGGETSIKSKSNYRFFKQFTDLVEKSEVKILMCYFARDKSRWEKLFVRDKQRIIKQSCKKTVITLVKNVDDLYKKIKNYDVLYIAGGGNEFIEPYLSKLSDLKTHLKNKVYIGSSMGVYIASHNYVLSTEAIDKNNVHKGLGLIPFNSICHWNVKKDKKKRIDLLRNTSPKLPVLLIDEEQSITFISS
jgi:peptidase E